MKKTRNIAMLAALALAATLTACSNDSSQSTTEAGTSNEGSAATSAPETNAELFEFASETFGPVSEVTVKVPQDLLDAAGLDESDLLVTSVTLKPHELGSAQACAVDLTHIYSDGVIGTPIPDGIAGDLGDTEAGALAFYLGRETSTYDGGTNTRLVKFIDDLDLESPEHGNYFSQDLQTITIVTDCAPSPYDESNLDNADNSFDFDTFKESPAAIDIRTNRVAGFTFNVMRDGTVTLLDASASDFVRDSSGYWIAD